MQGQGAIGLTIGLLALWRLALGDFALLLEINVPASGLALLVLQREGEDGVGLLDSVGLVLWVLVDAGLNGVEGGGGGESWIGEAHCYGFVGGVEVCVSVGVVVVFVSRCWLSGRIG